MLSVGLYRLLVMVNNKEKNGKTRKREYKPKVGDKIKLKKRPLLKTFLFT
jgi:hypothetical protein